MTKRIKLKKKAMLKDEVRNSADKIRGEVRESSRKNKELPATGVVEGIEVEEKMVSNIDSVQGVLYVTNNKIEKGVKKKRRVAIEEKQMEATIGAADVPLKEKSKKKKRNKLLELEKRIKETETEGEAGEVKGSVRMDEETGKGSVRLEANDCSAVDQSLGGRRKFDKDTIEEASKRKRKKLNALGSKMDGYTSKVVPSEVNDAHPIKKKSRSVMESAEPGHEVRDDEVEEISGVDDDHSSGMKKWLDEYWNSRPGLAILQQRIDDFIEAHEAKEEQERKEREALSAEGGWTVVVRQKGKKTTDPESGITVGSVASAVVQEHVAKKKKEIPLDFYRFQKREAKRNELMTLQSKFEQDKKRIQQLRAARKFRPY